MFFNMYFVLFLLIGQVWGFCWKPNSSPFYGPPKVGHSARDKSSKNVFWTLYRGDRKNTFLIVHM